MEETTKKPIIRTLTGTVVSDKMDKTVVVRVDRFRMHPLYGKRIALSKKYHVHDPQNKFKEGDEISFKAIRPLSKTKRWAALYN